jgi:hypothetical protein
MEQSRPIDEPHVSSHTVTEWSESGGGTEEDTSQTETSLRGTRTICRRARSRGEGDQTVPHASDLTCPTA